ncbi:hypothetical protein H8E06_00400 [bacterium]|nr:hypothetical protein [bacterium]
MPRKKREPEDDNISISKDLLPGYKTGNVEIQITYDFILDLYQRARALDGKEKEEMLTTVNELTKHIGKWLVS